MFFFLGGGVQNKSNNYHILPRENSLFRVVPLDSFFFLNKNILLLLLKFSFLNVVVVIVAVVMVNFIHINRNSSCSGNYSVVVVVVVAGFVISDKIG